MRIPAKVALALSLAIGTLGTTAIVAAAGSGGGGSLPGSRGGGPSVPIAVDPVVPGPCGVAVTSGSGPDGTVSYTPCPGEDPPRDPVPTTLEPTPGMDNVRARGWDSAAISDDGTAVTVTFYTGVAPCSVLDHIDVAYGADAVTITLYEGCDPSARDVACIDIAMLASATVKLDQPLGDRKIVDGADG